MFEKEIIEFKKVLKEASNVFIMGHKNIDLDSFAGCLISYCYSLLYKKHTFVVLDEKKFETSVNKAISEYSKKLNIISSGKVKEEIKSKSLLIIVDTNKKSLLQNSEILSLFDKIVIFDHHNVGSDTVSGDNVYLYNYPSLSSTVEIMTNLLIHDNYVIDEDVATVLLAGMFLDTNGFALKTTSDTYYAAYYLTSCGADNKKVQYLLKQDIKEYIEMQKVITEVKILKNIAISKGLQTKTYRREDLAKIADTILLFNNIEASFVIGKVSSGIGISARSMGDINVGEMMESIGGGGNNTEAAAILTDKTLNQAVDLVNSIINKKKR